MTRIDSTLDARQQRVQDIRRRIHAGRYPDNGVAFDIASDRLVDATLSTLNGEHFAAAHAACEMDDGERWDGLS